MAKPGVLTTAKVKLLIDQTIPTDRRARHIRPDLLVVQKAERKLTVLEVACTWEPLVQEREKEKYARYQDLSADLAKNTQ